MISKLIQLLSNKFAKSVVLISGGTVIAQVFNAIFSPVITRVYSPEQYGVLTVYLSILGIMSIAGSLRYEYAIPIAEDDIKASNVIALCIGILSIIALLSAILLLNFGNYVLKLFNGKCLSEYIFLIPVGIFFTGLYNIFIQWAFRKQNFKQISRTKINQSFAQNLLAVGLGLFSFGSVGLIGSRIIGQSAGIITLGMSFFKKTPELFKRIKIRDIIREAKRYQQFPIYSAPGQVLNTAGIQLPVLFITSMFGAEVIGYYGLANSIVNIPMSLIGRSIADVFYSEAARIGRTNPSELKKISNNLLKKLIILGMGPFIILILFGSSLFTIIFGSGWVQAGVFAQIIALLVYVRFIFTPISNIFMVFERQKESLYLDVLRVLLVLVTFSIAKFFRLSVYLTIFIYALAMSFIYLITYFAARKIINSAIRNNNTIRENSQQVD